MSKRALLVIDVQNIYTSRESEMYCRNSDRTISRINDLIADATNRHDLVVAVRHIHRKDGSDLGRMFDYIGEAEDDFDFKEGTEDVNFDAALSLPPDAVQISKTRYSAFVGTNLETALVAHGIVSVTICGFMTNFCCEATARHAHDLDYFVDFISDATGTPATERQTQTELRRRVADTLQAGYARTWTTKRWCARTKRYI